MNVVFLHPDLGIGGAERLIVDAAVALKQKEYQVKIITNHHNKDHCFPETRDGTLNVEVHGMWIPRSFFGRFIAFLAYVKMICAALCLVIFREKPDIIIVDQVSAPIPVLRWFTNAKILFYCHFPDLLLTGRQSFVKRLYRSVIDPIEEVTTSMAHKHLVNSDFTRRVFKTTFKSISSEPEILYPSINLLAFDREYDVSIQDVIPDYRSDQEVFLSINRYERKKNLPLALKAFGHFIQNLSPDVQKKYRLIMAGGYDERVEENVTHYKELVNLSVELGVASHTTFLKSPSEPVKILLLKMARALIYTPDKEHFGIVPLEAMYCRTPVIAVNSGGPMETIIDGVTGFLTKDEPELFSDAMKKVVSNEISGVSMGNAARTRVEQFFSFNAFANSLNRILQEM
ncbi:uncharacterized protein LOC136041012 [Artemia franciscana]|uniref:Alpha-1,3/1,6-mannosyltransferase ALG2 n=1 Tax=Artemia franciscana TaxID=6661 RepID=A0AA88KZG3_ARTSF|nr:hypothetical protein QYM36_009254 [Artemia franciscana]KAK2713324.1 hypothetical protein QYM36_009254 [Artemia franciscana]